MRRARRQKNKESGKKLSLMVKILLPIVIVVGLFLFFKFTTRYWDSKNKLIYISKSDDSSVLVNVLDPDLTEFTVIKIPGDTEVNVSRNYGTLRLKNVWQLGQDEKIGEKLMAETVTKNFQFPVFLYWDKRSTNIPMGDRLQALFFLKKVKSLDTNQIDLGTSQFLKKGTLTDGDSGYKIIAPMSSRVTSFFSDNKFVDENIRFAIIDVSGRPQLANQVGSILEVTGGKVVSIERQDVQEDLGCEVSGRDSYVVSKVANIFSCKKGKDGSKDLEIRIGKSFLF